MRTLTKVAGLPDFARQAMHGGGLLDAMRADFAARGWDPNHIEQYGMAWASSKIFMAFITDSFNNLAALDLDTDTLTVALFDNTITPSQTVTSANTAYAAGVWASGGVSDASGWPAAGRNLASVTSTFSSNVYTFDAADTASANSTTTLTNAYGCLVYENTLTTPVADQGICFNYFGGANSITSGSLSVVWNSAGIMAITA